MRGNKWAALAGRGYRIEDLGRPAIFLIPIKKLKKKIRGVSVEKDLHKFLVNNFGAYTTSTIPGFGFWKNAERATISDACREYEVSIFGKGKIPALLKKLAEIATATEEECIYMKAGQYSALVYPEKSS